MKKNRPKVAAFLLNHFFDGVEPLLTPPTVKHEIADKVLKVAVRFPADSGDESGRIWWMFDRAPDGSPDYLGKLIPDENSAEMTRDAKRSVWSAEIQLDPNASRIDLFSNHRKTIRFHEKSYATYVSCPYTRVTY